MSLKGVLTGWIETAANLLFAPLENAFPPLAGIAGTIVSAFAKDEANAILKVAQTFTSDISGGKDWEQAFTDTLNMFEQEEYAVITDVGKKFLEMFMHKAKG